MLDGCCGNTVVMFASTISMYFYIVRVVKIDMFSNLVLEFFGTELVLNKCCIECTSQFGIDSLYQVCYRYYKWSDTITAHMSHSVNPKPVF
jgi:hypothetical protein